MQEENSLLSRMRGCLVGHTIGDRLGWPYEMNKPGSLPARDSQGRLLFCGGENNPFWARHNMKPGDETDDSQASRALGEMLLFTNGRMDVFDHARRLIVEADRKSAGWGKTTKNSVEEFREFFLSNGRGGRSPAIAATFIFGQGCGNGVAMKVHVLAAFFSILDRKINSRKLMEAVAYLGFMTHGDPRATVAAYALAELITFLVLFGRIPVNAINEYSRIFLEFVSCHTKEMEEGYGITRQMQEHFSAEKQDWLFSQRVDRLQSNIAWLEDPIALRENIGTSCFALESVHSP